MLKTLETSKKLMEGSSKTAFSSQEDFLANHFPLLLPGNEKARKMTALSGIKWLELYKNQSPCGYLVRMCLGSSQWVSTRCLMIWRVSTTPQKRSLFRLAPLIRHIEETGFGYLEDQTIKQENLKEPRTWMTRLFPTPLANDAKNNGSPSTMRRKSLGLNALIGGRLNPNFLEWLMGYPIGWTEIKD